MPDYTETATAGIRVATPLSGAMTFLLSEGIEFGDTTANDVIQCLLEQVAITGTAFPNSDRRAQLDDSVQYSAALRVAWQVALDESIALTGEAQANAVRLGALIDTVHALGAVQNRLDAVSAVATVLAINSMIATGWKMEAIDTVAFQDALAGSLSAIAQLTDTAGFADLAAPSLRMVAVAADTVAMGDTPAASLELTAHAADGVMFYVTLRLGDGEYSGWVLNDGAASEYRNYPFNGFVEFPRGSKRYYGTSDDGLFELVGDTDAGEPIEAWIKTALMDFGNGQRKRVPDVYVAFAGDGRLRLKVVATLRNGTTQEHWYDAELVSGSHEHNGRFKVGRGLESRYWQFTLANRDGGDLQLDELAFRPLLLDKRI